MQIACRDSLSDGYFSSAVFEAFQFFKAKRGVAAATADYDFLSVVSTDKLTPRNKRKKLTTHPN